MPPGSFERGLANANPAGRGATAFRRRIGRACAIALFWLGVAGAASAVQLPLSVYDQNSGLASLSVTRMLQDREGFVWAGTEKGLYRFDGVAFVAVGGEQGFQTSEVIAMAEDAAGRLWVGSRMGLQLREHGRFERVRPDGRPLYVDRGQTLAPAADGGMLAVSGHRLLALARDGQGRWRMSQLFGADQLRQVPGLGKIGAILHRDDATWFGCGEELCRLQGGRLSRYGPTQGIPADTWLGLLGSRDGGLWVRGTRAIRYLAGGASTFVARDMPSGRAAVASSSLDLVEDRNGHVLTRTDLGLARWNGSRWELFGTAEGLPRAGVSALALDQDGSLWIGTFGRGVLHWNVYGAVENWAAAQGLNGSLVWSVARSDPDTLWVADEWGGSVIVRGQPRAGPWPLTTASPHQARQVLPMADGSVWYFLFDGRVLRYQPQERRTAQVAVLPFFTRGAYLDRAGRLWAYTLGGLYAVDTASGRVERVAAIPPAMCSDVAEDAAGRLWAACSAGLFRYAGGRWSRVRVVPGDSDGGYENVAVTPDGGLWLSSLQPGLLRGRVGDGASVAMAPVDDALLAASRFYFLRTDRRGRLWAGGGNGVDVFDGQQWVRITVRDGLLWDESNHGAFYADDDGSVWIGSPIGLSHLLRPEQLLAPRQLRPLLFSARYGKHELAAFASAVPHQAGSALALRLAVLGNSAGNPVHFRYRLLGVDADWVETATRELRYANLEPGRYRFELRVLDDDRRSLSEPLVLDFTIEPPWWRSRWALVAAALLALGALMLAWHWRVRVLVGHARRLERMVAERTADLEREKQELERARALLYRQATRDSLTGLLNREAAMQALCAALQRNRAGAGAGLAVGLLDLDHFKQINDGHGHLMGDAVLRHVAACLGAGLREGELLGRYGGEEWLLALPDIARDAALARVDELLRQLVAYRDQDLEIPVGMSAGLVWLAPGGEASAEALLRRADAMLYTAKRNGRAQTVMEPAD